VSTNEEHTECSYEYNQPLAQAAEKSGFEYGLTLFRFASSRVVVNQYESWSVRLDLVAQTSKITFSAVILHGTWNLALAAKRLISINQLSNGRIAITVVSGWFRGEFDAIGEAWPEHDQRYARSEEFIRSLRGIWNTDHFNFDGKFYQFKDYTLR